MSLDFSLTPPASAPPQFSSPQEKGPDLLQSAIGLAQKGQIQDAEKAFRQQLSVEPNDPAAHHNFAVFLSTQGRGEEAATHYRRALQHRPQYLEALRNFALLRTTQRQFQEAAGLLWNAVRQQPGDVQSLSVLGNTLILARRAAEAIPVYRHAIRLSPDEALLHNQLGLAFFDTGRFEEAEQSFLHALRLDPRLVSAHNNLGSLCKAMGRTKEAFACFEIALALDPESVKTKWNRALTMLSAGDFERGWQEYEWRWQRPETPPRQYSQPRWNGELLKGRRILLYAEQGLGDTIQFIRYASLLKAQGATVLFECPMPLAKVLRSVPGIDEFFMEGQPLPRFDLHAPLMGLPRLCKTTLSDVPAPIPYLTPDEKRVDLWRARLNQVTKPGDFLVGLAWQGNPHHQWDHFRSIPLVRLEPLTKLPRVRLVSLQRGPGIEQIGQFQRLIGNTLLVPMDGQQTTPEHLADTAGLMANLDLVISVDTATAHLSGALGRRTWTLLSFVADWRWMIDRLDTPWYPTMRLFRQEAFGGWNPMIVELANHLFNTRHLASALSGNNGGNVPF